MTEKEFVVLKTALKRKIAKKAAVIFIAVLILLADLFIGVKAYGDLELAKKMTVQTREEAALKAELLDKAYRRLIISIAGMELYQLIGTAIFRADL